MKERPILFSPAMVRAILDGRKTQTRRVAKPQPEVAQCVLEPSQFLFKIPVKGLTGTYDMLGTSNFAERCPYGKPGDRLWVRETTLAMKHEGDLPYVETMYPDDEDYDICYPSKTDAIKLGWRVRPSIYMPREASRITLEITNVRVERVNAISRADAIAEGCVAGERESETDAFHNLWDSINSKRGFGWDSNPWAWVIEFKRSQEFPA